MATWVCIAGGLLVLVAFVRCEAGRQSPLLQLGIFRDRAFVADNLVLFFAMMAFIPVFFLVSVHAQVSLGEDADHASLYLLLVFAGFAPASQVGGRMLDRVGAKLPIVIGAPLAAVGFALWRHAAINLHLSAQCPFIVMAGAGLGLLVTPSSTDAVNRAIGASYGRGRGDDADGAELRVRAYAALRWIPRLAGGDLHHLRV